MKPLVPAKLVLVVSASIAIAPRDPPAPWRRIESPPPPTPPSKSRGPAPDATMAAPPAAPVPPRVSLLTSKSARRNRPSAWTRMFPG